MSVRQFLLASMLCTRLCHDLTGPVGAVNNGVEFLTEDDSSLPEDVVSLISSSSSEAVGRLQFYRRAYGYMKEGFNAGITENYELIKMFFANSKISLDWEVDDAEAANIEITQNMAQLLLNMVIIVSSAIMREGVLKVEIQNNADEEGVSFLVLAEGDFVKPNEDINLILMGNRGVELNPKTSQAYLAAELSESANMKIDVLNGDNKYGVTAHKI